MQNIKIFASISICSLLALSACGSSGGQNFNLATQSGLSNPSAPNSPTPGSTPEPTPGPSPVVGRPSSDANISVCPSGTTIAGTDVDDGDSDIQWTSVNSAGDQYVFIKATEGITFVNPDFATDWPNAKAAGLIRSAYHFFHPEDDPVQAAQAFLNTIGTLAADDMAPMLDWEVTDNATSATAIQNAQTWLDYVEAATGRTPIIYVDPSFFNALGNPAQFAKYPLYIADYEVKCPNIPPPWTNWAFWQTSASGSIAGITGQSDLDVFNGTVAQLLSFVTTGTF